MSPSGKKEPEQRHDAPERDSGAGRTKKAVAVWLRLARLVSSQNSALGALLRDQGISLAQFDVLAQVGAAEGLTQKDLADRLVVTQGNVTQLLQKLERRNLVARPQSGRCNRLELTIAGRRLRNAIVPGQEEAIARLFTALSDSELETLSRLLRRMSRGGDGRTSGAAAPKEDTMKSQEARYE